MPNGCIPIDRRTKWGNPYTVKEWGRELAIQLYAEAVSGSWNGKPFFRELTDEQFHRATVLRDALLKRIGGFPLDRLRTELQGQNLACWCWPEPCHGDVLLRLANPSLEATQG